MYLSISQESILSDLNITLNTISLIACIFIILCYINFKTLRSFAFRMITWIAIADVFFSIGHLLGDQQDGAGCSIQSYIITYFELVSLIWTILIARVLQRIFLNGDNTVEEDENKYQLLAWGAPLLMVFLPESTNSYGDSGAFCWIKGNGPIDTMWRFFIFYIWLWLGAGFILYVYYKIQQQFKFIIDQEDETSIEQTKMVKRMRWYPFTLCVCYFFASIHRIYLIFNPDTPNFTLTILHILFVSLKGFFNSVIYGFTGNAGSVLYAFSINQLHKFNLCTDIVVSSPIEDYEHDQATLSKSEVLNVPGTSLNRN